MARPRPPLLQRILEVLQVAMESELSDDAASIVAGLSHAADVRDPVARGHGERVAIYARQLAEALGLTETEQSIAFEAGLLHDVGKLGVPVTILTKIEPLSAADIARIKVHPVVSERILRYMQRTAPLLDAVRHHHERFDGKGYPDGLVGTTIPVLARVIAIADAFDTMTTDRSYRQALPFAYARGVLRENRGPQWDPEIVEVFLEMHTERPTRAAPSPSGPYATGTLCRFLGFGVCLLDARGMTLDVNEAAATICGWPRQEMVGRMVDDARYGLQYVDGVPHEHYATRALRERRTFRSIDISLLRADGIRIWLRSTLMPVDPPEESGATVVCSFYEITAERQATAALLRERGHIAEVIRLQQDVVSAVGDLGSVMDLVVRRAQVITGADGACLDVLEGADLVTRAGTGLGAPLVGRRFVADGSLAGLALRSQAPLRSDDARGDPRTDPSFNEATGVRSLVAVPLPQDTRLAGVLKVVSEHTNAFTEQDLVSLQLVASVLGASMALRAALASKEELLARLAEQATHDALTTLPNRVLLEDRFAQALATERRSPRLALLLMDLDGFKAVNDHLGHHVGDALLQAVAERLRSALRLGDTVARLGGDEFAVLITQPSKDGAMRVARAITSHLARPFVLDGRTLQVGGSVGIALYPEHGHDYATVLRHADVAMYVAKRTRSGPAVYESAMDEHVPTLEEAQHGQPEPDPGADRGDPGQSVETVPGAEGAPHPGRRDPEPGA